MSTAHTPGPWQVMPIEADATYLRVRGKRLGARYKVANVLAPIDLLPQDVIESVANARLIAAAPELLAACQAQLAFDKFSDGHAYRETEESKRAWFAEFYRRGALAKSLLADGVAKATTGSAS